MTTAFLILAGYPSPATLAFADELARIIPNVIVVSDADCKTLPGRAELVHVPDSTARAAGYFNSSPLIAKTPIAWDKALLLMRRRNFDFAWLCEDDVFFVEAATASGLVTEYANSAADLICQHVFDQSEWPGWVHWISAQPFAPGCRAGAFLPLCRVSRALSLAVEQHIKRNGSLSFIESMLPSLVREKGLVAEEAGILAIPDFRYRPEIRFWEIVERCALHEATIFHPVKSDRVKRGVARAREKGTFKVIDIYIAMLFVPSRRLARFVAKARLAVSIYVRGKTEGHPLRWPARRV
jgi:hypothetical protein